MLEYSTYESWYGRDEPPTAVILLKAGGLTLEFENGDLRYLRYAGQELVRRIYVAVRDPDWLTIPADISGLRVDAGEDHFRIEFDAFHMGRGLQFRWQARIEGKADGTITYAMDGAAEGDFRYNRIGFCVLYPIRGIAGQPFQAINPQGVVNGVLPGLVGPQRIINGFEAPLFPPFINLSLTLQDGTLLTSAFEGDLFEMEDQRNWTDGSFKTYSTPISLGYPHAANTGQKFHQKVTLSVRSGGRKDNDDSSGEAQAAVLSIGTAPGMPLPKIGFGLPPGHTAFSAREVELLTRLRPDHLKFELHLGEPGWVEALGRAGAAARILGSALELALFLGSIPREMLAQLRVLISSIPLRRVIVFNEADAANRATAPEWIDITRDYLAEALPGVPFFGGTNGNFAQLNREPPDPARMDGLAYPLNPQVHASDERSLVEGLEAQRDTLLTARSWSPGRPLCISSVTLKPPFNQSAAEKAGPVNPAQLPGSVDRRQVSLFACVWTAGSLQSLAAGGAESITYYETTGWRGLMECEQGCPLPGLFPPRPGMVFPLYYLFAFLAEASGAYLLDCESSRPLHLGGLALHGDGRAWIVAANYLHTFQEVRINQIPEGQAQLLRINEETMRKARSAPETFLNFSMPVMIKDRTAVLTLQPYETALIEVHLSADY